MSLRNPSADVADHGADDPSALHLVLYFLICPVAMLSRKEAFDILLSASSEPHDYSSCFWTLPIPAHPPISHEQAVRWSRDYWPTIYKKHNPDGPQPNAVTQMEDSIGPYAAKWMNLARRAGVEAAEHSFGERIGAVIVEPRLDEGSAVVVAAGDARGKMGNEPNTMAHAVMRAIGMVSRRRRDILSRHDDDSSNLFLDHPMTPTECTAYSSKAIRASGYLCAELEIYVTHEPCIMCSMAILHSRFAKVIFATRMSRTGGLTAENYLGLGYGMSWLPQLNWRLLSWQYTDEKSRGNGSCSGNIHA